MAEAAAATARAPAPAPAPARAAATSFVGRLQTLGAPDVLILLVLGILLALCIVAAQVVIRDVESGSAGAEGGRDRDRR
jgi:hypothetical protein